MSAPEMTLEELCDLVGGDKYSEVRQARLVQLVTDIYPDFHSFGTNWVRLNNEVGNNDIGSIEIEVANDAPQLCGLRVPVSENDMRALNEHYHCVLPTVYMAVKIYDQADLQIDMTSMVNKPSDSNVMSDLSFCKKYYQIVQKKIEDAIIGLPKPAFDYLSVDDLFDLPSALVCGAYKFWCEYTPRKDNVACNFGSRFKGRWIQGEGFDHNPKHTDYSQAQNLVADRFYLTSRDGSVSVESVRAFLSCPKKCRVFGLSKPI